MHENNNSDPEFYSFLLEHDKFSSFNSTIQCEDEFDEFYRNLSIQFYRKKRSEDK